MVAPSLVALLVGAPLGLALVGAVAPAAAHPGDPDHGVNNTTFYRLWSGDADDYLREETYERLTGETRSPIQQLANGTDIPLDAPPKAVERWNQGDLQDFPETDRNVSIHPPDADLHDRVFIKDAYLEVFAVQPSTRARLSPSERPLYVATNGSVLGTVDYRVEHPANNTTGARRVLWRVLNHTITETRLRVDGRVETVANGTHTPHLPYDALDEYRGTHHTLTLEADIAVAVEKRVRTKHRQCRPAGNATTNPTANATTASTENATTNTTRATTGNESCRAVWNETVSQRATMVTVSDSVEVVEYDLVVSGYKARYPNGDLGLVIYKNKPWSGYSLPGGDVRGVWRFYGARDNDWDTLVRSTDSGTTEAHSPLHPLQVNAYPIETGPTPTPRERVTIIEVFGAETPPPTLPADVHLDVLTQPYTASFGLATRTRTAEQGLSQQTAWGLVRGVTAEIEPEALATQTINRSELTLTVVNRTEQNVTVRVTLADAATGAPITTAERSGYVVLADERVNTTNGTVVRTLSRRGSVSARYEPGAWWRNVPGYTGSDDAVLVRGTVLEALDTLYRLSIPISMFLIATFLIDRITGWRLWPPWRRL